MTKDSKIIYTDPPIVTDDEGVRKVWDDIVGEQPRPFDVAKYLPSHEAGEWDDEHDFLKWRTFSGYIAEMIRHPLFGHLCGYIHISPGHPFHGLPYSDERTWVLRVHGGVTYSAQSHDSRLPDHWAFGFDCHHAGDIGPRSPPVMKEMMDGVYRNQYYVMRECESLATQLFKEDRSDEDSESALLSDADS